MWSYIDYREAMMELGMPSRQDVQREMDLDMLLEDIDAYFVGDIPDQWQELIDKQEYNKLSWEWYEFRHPEERAKGGQDGS